jgi:hypothetical protein
MVPTAAARWRELTTTAPRVQATRDAPNAPMITFEPPMLTRSAPEWGPIAIVMRIDRNQPTMNGPAIARACCLDKA